MVPEGWPAQECDAKGSRVGGKSRNANKTVAFTSVRGQEPPGHLPAPLLLLGWVFW